MPGPIVMPLGMQLGTGKLLITAGTPFGGPPSKVWNGSISSTLPTVMSPPMAFPFVRRKWPVFGIIYGTSKSSESDRSYATIRSAGAGCAKDSANLAGSSSSEHWAVMAWNIGVNPAAWPDAPEGTAGPGTPGAPGNWSEGSGQGNRVGAAVVDDGVDVILEPAS